MCKAKDKVTEFVRHVIGHDQEVVSPQDWISEGDISYSESDTQVRIDGILPDVWIAGVTDTNSMDGPLDVEHNLICSDNDFYKDRLRVGDVIIFEKFTPNQKWIAHQIVREDNGWVTQGWNCSEEDWWRVQPEEIKYVVLGIIW